MTPSSELAPCALKPLSLGAIKPRGWLARQLRIQADGLSGHLDEFWPDIQDSAWFGGEAEGWERAPYWLDGVIPLARLLDDADLIGRTEGYVDRILEGQQDDGWLGPRPENTADYDIWSLFLVLKPLIQHYEATGDGRVEAAVRGCLHWIDRHIGSNPLTRWAKFRWFEALIGLYWLYERAPERWLVDLAVKLNAQGFHWGDFFERWPLTQPTPKGQWNFAGHVVNNAMAIKTGPLWWRLSGKVSDRGASERMMALLDQHHGMVTGVFTGDECLAGRSPIQGTELCAVVEHMYSLEVLLSVLGAPELADRLERIAFNALPATFSPDMWSHQYDQQANQVAAVVKEDPPWTTNSPDANIYGLEPNYGCCTANLSQGWPKFAAHLWMATPDNGLAAVAYAPSTVKAKIGGVPVSIVLDTDYPFESTVRLKVQCLRPTAFPLLLRIPQWALGATVTLESSHPMSAEPGTFFRLEREWGREMHVTVSLPMHVRTSQRPGGAMAVTRGPLVYAMKLDEQWQQIRAETPGRELPHADWEVRTETPWNMALCVDEAWRPKVLGVEEQEAGDCPFSPDGAPVMMSVAARRVPDWSTAGEAEPPPSPAVTDAPEETVTLIPYGCTNLRVTDFPTCR